jgi:hypothetical protein
MVPSRCLGAADPGNQLGDAEAETATVRAREAFAWTLRRALSLETEYKQGEHEVRVSAEAPRGEQLKGLGSRVYVLPAAFQEASKPRDISSLAHCFR